MRHLTSSDRRFAWELNQSEAPHLGTETEERFEELCAMSACAILATSGEAPAGFLLGMTEDAGNDSPNFLWFKERHRGFLYVDRLAVAAAHRREGHGRALYDEAERHARGAGLGLICCEVNLRPPNPGSLAFHTRLGFAKAGEQEAHGKLVAMLVKRLS